MASSSTSLSSCQLAYVDGPCSEGEETDFYSSKLGGKPVYFSLEIKKKVQSMAICKDCNGPLLLVTQAYCPLPEAYEHRIIYAFACNSRSCSSSSWLILRSILPKKRDLQQSIEAPLDEDKTSQSKPLSGWEEAEGDDFWKCSSSSFDGVDDMIEKLSAVKLKELPVSCEERVKEKKSEEQTENSKIESVYDQDFAYSLPSLYLEIEDESIPSRDKLLEHAKALYESYQSTSQLMSSEKETGGDPSNNWANEAYEKVGSQMDKSFFNFQARVQCNPDQCLRYEFNGNPLLFKASTKVSDIPACENCGSERVHEIQIMPRVLTELPFEERLQVVKGKGKCADNKKKNSWLDSDMGLEFGTVHIYTCKDNCLSSSSPSLSVSSSDAQIVKEFALVEMEEE